jgi:hypothetical protein
VPKAYKRDKEDPLKQTRVEAGTNNSTVTQQVIRGEEKEVLNMRE